MSYQETPLRANTTSTTAADDLNETRWVDPGYHEKMIGYLFTMTSTPHGTASLCKRNVAPLGYISRETRSDVLGEHRARTNIIRRSLRIMHCTAQISGTSVPSITPTYHPYDLVLYRVRLPSPQYVPPASDQLLR